MAEEAGIPLEKVIQMQIRIPIGFEPAAFLVVAADGHGRTHTILPTEQAEVNLHLAQAALVQAVNYAKHAIVEARGDASGLVLPNGKPHLTLH